MLLSRFQVAEEQLLTKQEVVSSQLILFNLWEPNISPLLESALTNKLGNCFTFLLLLHLRVTNNRLQYCVLVQSRKLLLIELNNHGNSTIYFADLLLFQYTVCNNDQ